MNTEEVVSFIESYFVTTVEPDGVGMHHIDDTEWQSVRNRVLKLFEPQLTRPDEDRLLSEEEIKVMLGIDWLNKYRNKFLGSYDLDDALRFGGIITKAQDIQTARIKDAEIAQAVKAEREKALSYYHTQLTWYLKTSDDLRGDIWSIVQSIEGEWMALRKELGMSTEALKE